MVFLVSVYYSWFTFQTTDFFRDPELHLQSYVNTGHSQVGSRLDLSHSQQECPSPNSNLVLIHRRPGQTTPLLMLLISNQNWHISLPDIRPSLYIHLLEEDSLKGKNYVLSHKWIFTQKVRERVNHPFLVLCTKENQETQAGCHLV